ncbi:MAG: NADP-dependent phosphogluconate dehydrogenase [Opitutales bacterium]
MANANADIGLIGLAVMGQNLALNIADHGFRCAVYNRTTEKMTEFVEANPDTPGGLDGYADFKDFVASLKRPRKAIIMVKAGKATDAVIDQLAAEMEEGDIIIDGGNANWNDTIRREHELREKGLRFIGSGVSGGEEGARFGPSLMPGGEASAYDEIADIWKAIAAKVDPDSGKPLLGGKPGQPVEGGVPCTAYIGANGSGHYVKMVHNGIEYGDMQMICEVYEMMTKLLGMRAGEISEVFKEWNQGVLDSFLIEITAEVLAQADPRGTGPLVDVILDTAGQKGTGRWTAISSLELGVSAPTVAEAVFARCVSAIKEERVAASRVLPGPEAQFTGKREAFIESLHAALYCSKICSYAQGFQLLRAAQGEFDWTLNFGEIAQIWRGGCIIRAVFLQKITEAFEREPGLANLLLDPYFKDAIDGMQKQWREVVAQGALQGIPTPCLSSALFYYDSYRAERLPANLLQGQRDFFGAHTYERLDCPRGEFFHIDWPEPGRPELPA